MYSATTVIFVILLYMAVLFAVAQFVELRASASGYKGNSALVYALSITVYCTSWTFYGSVGMAASAGLSYVAIYLGSILAIFFWWRHLRRLVHVKETYHISSLADFISARYNRSQSVAALVTLIALIGIVPYIALQLKAVVSTYAIITTSDDQQLDWGLSGMIVTLLMIVFTIVFGARRLDPTERHPGMMTALALQCVLKLVAFLAVGAFVTFSMFDGFGDLFERLESNNLTHLLSADTPDGQGMIQWLTLIILGAAAIQYLPRQFHVAVVENSDERHIRTAMWLVPLYLVLINIFVLPIAAGGLLEGLPGHLADSFVLLLPQSADHPQLSLLAFIGGFSAASGMIIVSAMTLSTMATNHLLLPLINRSAHCAFLRHYLLQCRWLLIALILATSYWFARLFSDTYMLASMGMLSFVAVFQFVPALLGGLLWKRGNRAGAIYGLSVGFALWFYTLLVPVFVTQGWVSPQLLTDGPWTVSWLRPQALLGLEGLPDVPHSLIWTFIGNSLAYIAGSLLHHANKEERTQLQEFMRALDKQVRTHKARPTGLDAYIELEVKVEEAYQLLCEYLPQDKADLELARITEDLQVKDRSHLTIIELVEFHRMLENHLAGSIGAASAHRAIEQTLKYSDRETKDLQAVFSHIQTGLYGKQGAPQSPVPAPTPAKGTERYSFIEELQSQIDDQAANISQLKERLETLDQRLEASDERLFKERLQVQKLTQENQALKAQLSEFIKS